jgi:hypothetical protein
LADREQSTLAAGYTSIRIVAGQDKDFAPLNLAIVHHIVLNMLKRDTSQLSLKRKKKPEGFRQPRPQGSAACLLAI